MAREHLYLGSHLDVDLVLSPLSCDGIVPAKRDSELSRATMNDYIDYIHSNTPHSTWGGVFSC